jgi:hypothetical protein
VYGSKGDSVQGMVVSRRAAEFHGAMWAGG